MVESHKQKKAKSCVHHASEVAQATRNWEGRGGSTTAVQPLYGESKDDMGNQAARFEVD